MSVVKEELCFRSFNQENTVVGYVYIPQKEQIKGVIQIIHGMAEHFGRYQELCDFFAQKGYVVCGHDQVGHGKTAFSVQNLGYFGEERPGVQTLVEDVHYLQVFAARRFRKVPYFLLGHSMGSFVARVYASQYGSEINGLILSGTGSGLGIATPFIRAIIESDIEKHGSKYVNKRFDKVSFGGYNRKIKSAKTAFDWLSRDSERVKNYISDDFCGFVFTNNGYQTVTELITLANEKSTFRLLTNTLPILLISGDKDPVGNYGKGVRQVVLQMERAGLTNIECHLYENGRHEILQEINRHEVFEDISKWLEK